MPEHIPLDELPYYAPIHPSNRERMNGNDEETRKAFTTYCAWINLAYEEGCIKCPLYEKDADGVHSCFDAWLKDRNPLYEVIELIGKPRNGEAIAPVMQAQCREGCAK